MRRRQRVGTAEGVAGSRGRGSRTGVGQQVWGLCGLRDAPGSATAAACERASRSGQAGEQDGQQRTCGECAQLQQVLAETQSQLQAAASELQAAQAREAKLQAQVVLLQQLPAWLGFPRAALPSSCAPRSECLRLMHSVRWMRA